MSLIGNTSILEILISLVLIYALLSIFTSIVSEWWSHRNKSRGKMLQEAIFSLLSDPLNREYGQLFFNHHLINKLINKETNRPPQYISSSLFADALIDVISNQSRNEIKVSRKKEGKYEISPDNPGDTTTHPIEEPVLTHFKNSLDAMADSPFRDMQESFYEKSGANYDKLKSLLEKWYDDYMERVSGWYKTKQKRTFLLAGFFVAILLNADSIFLFKVLSLNEDLTNRLVAVAEGVADDYSSLNEDQKANQDRQIGVFKENIPRINETKDTVIITFDDASVKKYFSKYGALLDSLKVIDSTKVRQSQEILTLVSELKIPIGWNKDYAPLSWFNCNNKFHPENKAKPENGPLLTYLKRRNATADIGNILLYLLGIAITGYSLSFGAPFWFETLVKLVNIRRAGGKPKTVTETK